MANLQIAKAKGKFSLTTERGTELTFAAAERPGSLQLHKMLAQIVAILVQGGEAEAVAQSVARGVSHGTDALEHKFPN